MVFSPSDSGDDADDSTEDDSFSPFSDVTAKVMPAVSSDGDENLPPAISFKCDCQNNNGLPCYTAFDVHDLHDARLQYCQPWITKDERDIAILAKIESSIHLDDQTRRSHKKQKDRKASRTDFFFRGRPLCMKVWLQIHNIGEGQFYSLKKHYLENGVEARRHGSNKKAPRHALKYNDVQRLVQFVSNYAETHAITLPGRTPRH